MSDDRRHRIGRRHLLHPDHRALDLHAATAGMVAMHATDPASVFLGLLARTRALTVADPGPWVEDLLARTAAAVGERGEVTARELTAVVPGLETRWNPAPQSKWGTSSPVTSRILSQLAMEGMVERARPVGSSFTSTQ